MEFVVAIVTLRESVKVDRLERVLVGWISAYVGWEEFLGTRWDH